MRYYSVQITKDDGTPYLFKSLGGLGLTSLLPQGPQNPTTGLTNPAALQIELDIAVANQIDPDSSQGAYLRVWGLGLQDIGNASDLNGLNVKVFGGMARGLPLANPAQAGLLMQGTILQAFGNWQGTDQTVDMIFVAGGDAAGSASAPSNFPFSCPAGTPLARAIANTLSVAMPNTPASISISPDLVQNYDQVGHYQSLAQFSSFINGLSIGIIGGTDYNGVQITTDGQTIKVFDGKGPAPITGTKAIAVADLIGQPTWIGSATVSIKTVMRSDIHMGDTISLPQTIFSTTGAAFTSQSSTPQTKLTFSGSFSVLQVHHYGHSRQPSADAWNTTFQVTPI